MEDVLSSVGQLPESAVSAFSPWPPVRGAPVPAMPPLPPLALGSARIARVALRRLSADVAQSLTLISQRGIDCLITMAAGADRPIANIGNAAPAPGTIKQDGRGSDAAQGWRLSLSAGVAQPLRDACDREAILDWSGARMRLLYRNAAALSWLAARLNIDSDMPLDDVSAQSLRGAAFDDLIARLALNGLGAPHIVADRPLSAAARRDGQGDGDAGDFSFVVLLQALNSAKPTILAVLEADAFGINVLAALLQHRPERPRVDASISTSETGGAREGAGRAGIARASPRFGLPMVTRIVLPSVRLPMADVRALSAGDVVLLGLPRTSVDNSTPEGASRRVSLAATEAGASVPVLAADVVNDILPGYLEVGGRACWRVAVMRGTTAADSGYVRLINREFGVADDGMDDVNDGANGRNGANRFAASDARHDADGGADAGTSWTDQVPVRVTFELGTKTAPLAELQRWREGSIVTFQPPFPQQAAIVRAVSSPDDVDAAPDTRADDAIDLDERDDANDGDAVDGDDDSLGIDVPAGDRRHRHDDTTNTAPRHDATSIGDGAIAEDRPMVTVRIRVNGVPLGIGELVDIDGQLGVSIVTLFEGEAGATRDEISGVQGEALP